jgi:RNA polymerase sigma-70 factor (ECF subfamily)
MGDPDDFEVLFNEHYPKVLAYVTRRIEAARAHDVVAQTFTSAWLHRDGLPPDPLPWLYRTAANSLANEQRSSRRQDRLVTRLIGRRSTSAADHAVQVVENDQLRTALARLNPADREALLLISWEELDHATAAAVVGCSVPAFRVRVHRARRRLERLLRATDGEGAHHPGRRVSVPKPAVSQPISAHHGGVSDV